MNDNDTVFFQKGIINDTTNICKIKPLFDYTIKRIFTTKGVSLLKHHTKTGFITQLFLFTQIYTKMVFTSQLLLFKQMTMSWFTFTIESSIMPLITYQHIIFHFYDIQHPNHQGEWIIPCSFNITRVRSLVVTYCTLDVRVTLTKLGTT